MDDDAFDLDNTLDERMPDLVESGEKSVARNILDKASSGLSEASRKTRDSALPEHLRLNFRTKVRV